MDTWTPDPGMKAKRVTMDRTLPSGDHDPPLAEDLLDARFRDDRRDRALPGRQLVEIHLGDGPDVQPDVVHVQPGTGRPALVPGPPNGLHARGQHAFDVLHGGDTAGGIADHGELAHLGQRHQALVGLVVRGNAVVEQDVLGRVQPGKPEVAQTPQVQAAADPRMNSADQVVLDHVLGRRPEGEIGDRLSRALADGDGEPAHQRRQLRLRQPHVQVSSRPRCRMRAHQAR